MTIQPFTFPTTGQSVRTLLVDGEPWFVASDVTDVLGYSNGRMAVGALPDRMKGSVTIADGTPGNPNRTIISEPGVYRLVMRSTLLTAEAFQDWLAEAAGDYSVREAAQILNRDPRVSTGQKRLFEYMRTIGWLDRHNTPYQAQISLGRLALRARSYEHPNRDELVATQQVRITAKGLGELHRRLGGISQLDALASEELAA